MPAIARIDAAARLRWLSSSRRRHLVTWLVTMVVGGVAGSGYVMLAYPDPVARGVISLASGFRAGVIISGLCVGFRLVALESAFDRWLKQRPVAVAYALQVAIYTSLCVVGLLANTAFNHYWSGREPMYHFEGQELARDTVFSLLVTGVVLFVLQARDLIGARPLVNLLIGRYNTPLREERIFLILDLVGSTTLAERIGDERFHTFISAMFFDADAPIVDRGGEIYAYVGDALIATWPSLDTRSNRRAFEAIAAVRAHLAERAAWYQAAFRHVPALRAILHQGPVVAGECGDSKRQITYLGGALNAAARLEALAKDLGESTLASQAYVTGAGLAGAAGLRDLGRHTLKGIGEAFAVFALAEAPPFAAT